MCECSGCLNPQRGINVKEAPSVSEVGLCQKMHYRPTMKSTDERFECEHTCWDPKDGELCLSRAKPGETLVEVRSDSNVQIDRRTWV